VVCLLDLLVSIIYRALTGAISIVGETSATVEVLMEAMQKVESLAEEPRSSDGSSRRQGLGRTSPADNQWM
jgi:hypothetical protein